MQRSVPADRHAVGSWSQQSWPRSQRCLTLIGSAGQYSLCLSLLCSSWLFARPMRYGLRTLMIVLALGPPVLAGGFFLLPMVPLGISVRGMQIGFCAWLAVVVYAIILHFKGRRRPT